MARLTLLFEQLSVGGFIATLVAGEAEVTLYPSYLSDAPGDLARAAVALLKGADRAVCAWADEPGEYRWLLTRRGDLLDVTLLEFDETFSKKRDEAGRLLFHTECELMRFATQLKGQLQQLLNQWGEEGYKHEWRHAFPRAEFERLKELIAERKRAQRRTE